MTVVVVSIAFGTKECFSNVATTVQSLPLADVCAVHGDSEPPHLLV